MRKFLTVLMTAAFGLAMGSVAQAAAPVPMRLCGGAPGGNYEFSAVQIAMQAGGNLARGSAVQVIPVNTNGSLENLQKLDDGSCDAAIVQADALNVYLNQNAKSALNVERTLALYDEYVHLICN